MEAVDPEEILKDFSIDHLALLGEIIEIAIPLVKKTKEVDREKLMEMLLDYCMKEGIHRIFQILKVKSLQKLVSPTDFRLEEKWKEIEPKKFSDSVKKNRDPNKKYYPTKLIMTKMLMDYLGDKKLKDVLNSYDQSVLLMCCEDIDDLSSYSKDEKKKLDKDELIGAIMNNVNIIGINHLLQKLNVEELKEICKELGLTVDSTSVDILLESILEKKSYKQKKSSKEKPSKNKPKIESGISKIDLNQWYNKEDLEQWLKDKAKEDEELKEIKISGKKSQLIDRIIKVLNGEIKESMKKGKKKRSRSRSTERSKEGDKKRKKK